jgi:hypothetical protein
MKEELLSAFERKVLRKIFRPVKDSEVRCIRYNRKLYKLFKEPDIMVVLKR